MGARPHITRPLGEFDLPPRVIKALNALGAKSLLDASRIHAEELLALRNFGETSLRALRQCLLAHGLGLGLARSNEVGQHGTPGPTPLSRIEISKRLRAALERLGVQSIEELEELSQEAVLALPNVGATTAAELRSLQADLYAQRAHSSVRLPCDSIEAPLARAGISKRLVNALSQLGVKRLSEAVSLTRSQVLAQPNVAERTIRELEGRLTAHGLALKPEPDESPTNLDPNATVDEMLHGTIVQRGGDRAWLLMSSLLGWGEWKPQTLEAVGNSIGVTRERVRQIREKTLDTIRRTPRALDRLEEAMDTLSALAPTSAAAADRVLVESGLLSQDGDLRSDSLIELWELLGDDRQLLVEDGLIFKAGHVSPSKVRSIATRLAPHWGCTTVKELCEDEALKGSIGANEDFVRLAIAGIPDLEWLDEEQDWFWISEQSRNRVVSRIKKVLATTSSLDLGLLRAGISRDYLMRGFAPPRRILTRICERLDFCVVEGAVVKALDPVPRGTLVGAEKVIVEILKENMGALGTRELERIATERGVKRPSIWRCLSYSPVLVRPVRGVFALRGASLTPGQVREAQGHVAPPKRRVVDSGWTKHGTVWCAYEVSYSSCRSGVLGVPASIFPVVRGEHTLVARDAQRMGTVVVNKSAARGLYGFFHRRGVEEGDQLVLEWDLERKLVLAVVGDEVVDAYLEGEATYWPTGESPVQ